jgi:RNA polymerase sigma-70 factor (ECF subfamily)
MDDSGLLRQAADGDLDAFNAIVERYQVRVYNLCLRMVGPAGAEDATQETFIRAWRALDRFRGDAFAPWLLRIAANACHDELRRRRARPAMSLGHAEEGDNPALDVPSSARSPDEEAQSSELRSAIEAALFALPEEQRLAVILCDIQGMDYAEIALVMSCSLGTVKSRTNRGRRRLRDLIQNAGELLPDRFRSMSDR